MRRASARAAWILALVMGAGCGSAGGEVAADADGSDPGAEVGADVPEADGDAPDEGEAPDVDTPPDADALLAPDEDAEPDGDEGAADAEADGPADIEDDGPADAGPEEVTPPSPTWVDDVSPLVALRCTKCHSGPFADAGVSFTEYQNTLAASAACAGMTIAEAMAHKVRGDWADHCTGARMPFDGTTLDAAQQDLLMQWVEAGAPEN